MEGVVDGVGGGVEEIWRGIVKVFKIYTAEVCIRTFSRCRRLYCQTGSLSKSCHFLRNEELRERDSAIA